MDDQCLQTIDPKLAVLVQGGIGPAGLATEDLHVLDFTDMDKPRWHRHDPHTPTYLSGTL